MKLLILLLLIFNIGYSQSYEFETIDVRTPESSTGWEIRQIPGEVRILPDSSVEFVTPYNYQQFTFLGELPFYLKRETISRYVDQNENDIRIRWDWSDSTMNYVDMYFMSNIDDNRYFRLCLKRCKE